MSVDYKLISTSIFGGDYQCSGCEYEPESISFTWIFCPNCGVKIEAFDQDKQLDLDFDKNSSTDIG